MDGTSSWRQGGLVRLSVSWGSFPACSAGQAGVEQHPFGSVSGWFGVLSTVALTDGPAHGPAHRPSHQTRALLLTRLLALIFRHFSGHESAAAEHRSHLSLAQVFLQHKAFWVVRRSPLLCSRCFPFGPERFKLCAHTHLYMRVCASR